MGNVVTGLVADGVPRTSHKCDATTDRALVEKMVILRFRLRGRMVKAPSSEGEAKCPRQSKPSTNVFSFSLRDANKFRTVVVPNSVADG